MAFRKSKAVSSPSKAVVVPSTPPSIASLPSPSLTPSLPSWTNGTTTSTSTATAISTSTTNGNVNGATNGGGNADEAVGLSNPQMSQSRRRMLDLVNGLHNTGVQVDIDLPQIAVIGNQSAGKSSLIESISGITLPRASGTCTRCPTECRLSHSTGPWKCIVSLRITTNAKGQPLGQSRNEPFGPVIYDKREVEDRIRRAQLAILNPKKPASSFLEDDALDDVVALGSEGGSLTFSENCVSLAISGPDVADLSFVDLPGLIASVGRGGNSGDIQLVEGLVTSYIKKANCIILLTVACETDFENQGAHQLVKRYDPEGKRTIGVLTKPDRIPTGEEHSWLQFIRNEVEPLQNNWFCVKQPSSSDLKQTEWSWQKARAKEDEFFTSTSPWNELEPVYARYLRTRNLLERVSAVLSDLIAKRLPEIQKEIESMIMATRQQIGALPKPPPQNAFGEVAKLLQDFNADLKRHIEGIPSKDGVIQRIRDPCHRFRGVIRGTAPEFRPFEKSVGFSGPLLAKPKFLECEEGDCCGGGLGEEDRLPEIQKEVGKGDRLPDIQKEIKKEDRLPDIQKEVKKEDRLPEIQKIESKVVATQQQTNAPSKPPPQNAFDEVAKVFKGLNADFKRHIEGIQNKEGIIRRIRVPHDRFRGVRRTAPELRPVEKSVRFSEPPLAKPKSLEHEEGDCCGDGLGEEENVGAEGDVIYADEVYQRMQDARARELPGHFPFVVQREYIQEALMKWEGPAVTLCDEVHVILTGHIEDLVCKHFATFGQGMLQRQVGLFMHQHLGHCLEAAKGKVKWLMKIQSDPFTLNNHYLADYKEKFLMHYRQVRKASGATATRNDDGLFRSSGLEDEASDPTAEVLSLLARIGYEGLTKEDLPKLLGQDAMEPALNIMATVRAYFQVAYKRFIDNVPMAIDYELVRGGEQDVFRMLWDRLGMDKENAREICDDYAQEAPQVADKREELHKKMERLRQAANRLIYN